MGKMATGFATVTNKEILQLNEEAVLEKHEEGNEIRLAFFTGKALSV